MIEYERLLQIAKKMHLWIFKNSFDEFEVYDELGLTDEENKILGSVTGKIVIKDKEVVNHIKDLIKDIEAGENNG